MEEVEGHEEQGESSNSTREINRKVYIPGQFKLNKVKAGFYRGHLFKRKVPIVLKENGAQYANGF